MVICCQFNPTIVVGFINQLLLSIFRFIISRFWLFLMNRAYDEDDSDDSDIVEVAVVTPKSSAPIYRPGPIKRRKSSPQMDPLPSYTPTPLHILEARARANSAMIPVDYTPSPPTPTPTPARIPAPAPTPSRTLDQRVIRLQQQQQKQPSDPKPQPTRQQPQQKSLPRQQPNQQKEKESQRPPPPPPPQEPRNNHHHHQQQPSQAHKRTPIAEEADEDSDEGISPVPAKKRIAHKPTIPVNKHKRPRAPLGMAKKVPPVLRIRYLDVLIDEYLRTGHPEEKSYQEALKEEQAIANRAATKSIYINLIAGAKKKIREQAGISTLPQDDDPKYINGNKVVSHSEILTGKVSGTFSIEKKQKSKDPAELTEYELYDRLLRYLVPVDELEAYGYPDRDPENPELRKVPLGKTGQRQQLREQLATSYICERCTKVYRVEPDGMPSPDTSKCIHHPGHLWNERINRSLEKRYSCCKGEHSAGGCSSNPYHVQKGELELANFQGYVETQSKPERDPNRHGIYALDCEMCYTTYGLELTRVTVINHKSDVVYEKLVKPDNPILDYNTKFSGIKDGDLDYVHTSLADVQRDLMDMFSSQTILVGHSLDSDMRALKIFHKRFIDTAYLFPHKRGLPFKRALRTLMVENLRVIIQEDVGHDSKEDACAALRLVMWKAKTDAPAKAT